jgi:hypothetical protein
VGRVRCRRSEVGRGGDGGVQAWFSRFGTRPRRNGRRRSLRWEQATGLWIA